MQASLTTEFFATAPSAQATRAGRPIVCQPFTNLANAYPHTRVSAFLGQRLLQASQARKFGPNQPQLVCFAAPASLPESAKDVPASLKPLPRAVENIADDPSLHNPLQRLHRLGTGWFDVILEYEGVLVEDTSDLHSKAWEVLANEEGQSRPLHWALKRAEGMKSDQVALDCHATSPASIICSLPTSLSFFLLQHMSFSLRMSAGAGHSGDFLLVT